MANKFYAVKQGRKPGIYRTWADCQKQTQGYSGAVFKSFVTEAEARAYLGLETRQSVEEALGKGGSTVLPFVKPAKEADMMAYIDGSYDKATGAVGAGGVIMYGGEEQEFSFGTKNAAYAQFWNVAGELLAAMHVVKVAQAQGVTSVALYYDYMGIEQWATGGWKRNNVLTQQYHTFMQGAMKSLRIDFHKVAAHTGVAYNERADQLAKAGTKTV